MVMRLPVATKAAKGRAPQLTPELLINMYAEQAPSGAKSQVVALGCPGATFFSAVSTAKIRGLYRTMRDGALYVVAGTSLYKVDSDGSVRNLGTIAYSGRVGFAESEREICIVASPKGYTYNSTDGLKEITTADFPGAASVTYMDGYFIFNNRQNGQKDQFFISDLRNGQIYDASEFATAERYPDNIVRVFSDHSELLLFGSDSIEIWFNAGNADFPFARAQGSVIEQGLGAKWSVSKLDESVIWLDNEGMVRRLEGNTPVRISTHAIEYQISLGDWENAYSFSYTQEGHQFYVLTVPASNNSEKAGTYVFDAATQLWHIRKSYEMDISRMGFYAKAFGKHIGGDVISGNLYELSLDVQDENGEPLISQMQFPQVQNNGNRFIVHKLQLDAEVGSGGLSTKIVPVLGAWHQRTSGVASRLNDVFVGADYSIVVGSAGLIRKSIDKGESWASRSSGLGSHNIAAISKGDGKLIAVGDSAGRTISSDGDAWAGTTETFGVVYDQQSPPVTEQEVNPFGFEISPDGTKMYVCGITAGTVFQYTLSDPGNVSSAAYDSKSFGTQIPAPYKVRFKPDGTKMWVSSSAEIIYQYPLSTPWEVDTASYDSISFDYSGQVLANGIGLFVKPDGSAFYISWYDGQSIGYVHQYVLSSPWDLSTASYSGRFLSVNINDVPSGVDFRSLAFNLDGTRLFLADASQSIVLQYTLLSPWDVDTASYDSISHDFGSEAPSAFDISWNDIGNLFYILSAQEDRINQFKIAPSFDLSGIGTDFKAIDYGDRVWIAGGTLGYIYRSEDEGENWSTVATSFAPNTIYAVKFAIGIWLIAGENGTMYRSTDNGRVWSPVVSSSFEGSTIYGVEFGKGWWVAVGDSGKIARSSDQRNWRQIESPFNGRINSINYNEGLWVAVGDNGEIGYSVDNGETWALVDSSFDTTNILGIDFNGTLGIACGESGKIANVTTTTVSTTTKVDDPQVMLDVSKDGGKTYGMTQPWRSLGKVGEYDKRVIWRRLGQCRSFTPKVSISDPVRRAVFTAYAEIEPCD